MEKAIQRFRYAIQGKPRIIAAWIAGAFLVFSAREYPNLPGIAVCFLGATLRYWASGFLRKDTRPAVGGPYAWVRNPLYLGTYLMALGAALSTAQWTLLIVISVVFAMIYHFIILEEEVKLEKIFGQPYLQYCQLVPRFFPRPWPAPTESLLQVNPEKDHLSFSSTLASKNKAFEAYATFAVLMGLLTLIAFIAKSGFFT
ncbi:MAG: isoprenylcysteine carboxylmethyltransferase family protein [Bdellovibrionales bacterium]|nr:isoprenylcysteine carboxylmethyltransferase family protein [Bdellovibrionales bacterium]